mmetsp:Transcript_28761/g.83200  ORF Transcript_28761/g.83200 Transcript_28761/m.83200 type:complete len:233 (-) Transcript_28761:532-1230(-)
MEYTARRILSSSRSLTPKDISGLSRQLRALGAYPRFLEMPLRSAQSKIIRSLSSVYFWFCSRNVSSQSKVPSSGSPTGTRTSYLPSAGASASTTSASVLAAPCTIRHLKGKGANGSGPKFTCDVMFLKVTAGNRAFPFRRSGKACGWDNLRPSLKRLTVLKFACPSCKFKTTANTLPLSEPDLSQHFVRTRLCSRESPSKQMLSLVSPRKRFESEVAKPTLRTCRCPSVLWL